MNSPDSDPVPVADGAAGIVAGLEAVRAAWLGDADHTASACAEQVARAARLPEPVVRAQLDAVVDGADPATIVVAVEAQRHELPLRSRARRVLHLIAGNVPGLAIESLCWGLLTDARHVVVPSRTDPSAAAWHALLGRTAPQLAARIELAASPDWDADGAIVMGSDATVALVRERLGSAAAVTAFGDRQSLALIDADTVGDAELEALVDDACRFAQRGCMSPTSLLVRAAARASAEELVAALPARIEGYLTAHGYLAADPMLERRILDARMLAAATSGGAEAVRVGPVELAVMPSDGSDWDELLRGWPGALSTIVVAAGDQTRQLMMHAASIADASRIVAAGQAHVLLPGHLHEGVGHLSGILRES